MKVRGLKARAIALVVLLAGGAAGAQGGAAASLASLEPCSNEALTQPFRPWLDYAHYVPVPDGGVEARASGWVLNGAKTVTGNETYYVRSSADSRSLALPAGSSATTPRTCAGLAEPTLRLFVLNSGSLLSTLEVEVVYTDLLGVTRVAPVAVLTGTETWQPTVPMAFLANVTSLNVAAGETTSVAFRFTPQGTGGSWRIDDVYVDPYKGS